MSNQHKNRCICRYCFKEINKNEKAAAAVFNNHFPHLVSFFSLTVMGRGDESYGVAPLPYMTFMYLASRICLFSSCHRVINKWEMEGGVTLPVFKEVVFISLTFIQFTFVSLFYVISKYAMPCHLCPSNNCEQCTLLCTKGWIIIKKSFVFKGESALY